MFKKAISYLYDKYCRKNEMQSLYLDGIQRDFSIELTPPQEQQFQKDCLTFTVSGACRTVFNRLLKEYVEALFRLGETEEVRNTMFNNMNVLLKAEQAIYGWGVPPQNEENENDIP